MQQKEPCDQGRDGEEELCTNSSQVSIYIIDLHMANPCVFDMIFDNIQELVFFN